MAQRTLLRAVLEQRGWLSWAVFEAHFTSAARRVSEQTGLAQMSTSQATFKRWLGGEHDPRSLAGVVLEEMLGIETELLFRPAASRDVVLPRPLQLSSRVAALALDARWASSTLSPGSPAAGVEGRWQLDGLGLFDGTSVAVQTYEAVALPDEPDGVADPDRVVAIGPEDYPHLRSFVRPLRRALVLGSLSASGLYVLDAAHARRYLAVDQPVELLPIPAAYRLDDLTFGILWALINLDDGLSADDHVLHAEESGLEQELSRPRSAVARAAVPGLSRIGASWLGSRLCAQHAVRQLPERSEPWALWNRDSRGEEAAGWLFFRHQHLFLAEARRRLGPNGVPLGSAFCVPAAVVKDSPPYERILLFLAVAWMELQGLVTWVCAEPEYAQIDGLVLVPGRRAILTNWLRTPDISHVDVTDRRSRVRGYGQALHHARTHSVTDGATPAARLAALAEYLELDWPWLAGRCRELGGYGTVDMLQPRSRLITMDELDQVLDFVGRIGPA